MARTKGCFFCGWWSWVLVVLGGFALLGRVDGVVRINEFVASNQTGLRDEDGDWSDWVELHNCGDEEVSLEGWGISDDAGEPYRWVFPEVVIPAGGYLLVWVSGKDRRDGMRALHANFALSAEGEEVVLTMPSGELASRLGPVALPADVGYGVGIEVGPRFFLPPTPGQANAGRGYLGVLDPPVLDPPGGYYPEPVEVVLDGGSQSRVIYSMDGSVPSLERLGGEPFGYKVRYPREPFGELGERMEGRMESWEYRGAVRVGGVGGAGPLGGINTCFEAELRLPREGLARAVVLRARCFRDGYLPSRTVTHTYFVGQNAGFPKGLPVVSIAADADGFFDYDRGIYVPGRVADEWRLANPGAEWNWAVPANYRWMGDGAERAVHFEWLDADGVRRFAKDVGARVHGAASRANYLKSLRLHARREYDAEAAMRYGFFPGLVRRGSGVMPLAEFGTLLLRNGGNDARGSLVRDALLHGLVAGIGLDTQAHMPVLHYLNGEAWGIINLRERIDAAYFSGHYGMAADEVVVLSAGGTVEEGLHTDVTHYWDLLAHVSGSDMTAEDDLRVAGERMDLLNHARYTAFQVYIGNTDWPANNLLCWRKRSGVAGGRAAPGHDGRWRWVVYDTDLSFNPASVSADSLGRILTVGGADALPEWSTRLFRRLMRNPIYQRMFLNALADLMQSAFAPARVAEEVDRITWMLDPAREEHWLRWGEPGPTWEGSRVYAAGYKRFAEERPGHMRRLVVERFGLEGTGEVLVRREGLGGTVKVNGLAVHASPVWKGVYFRGVPVELTAEASPGHRFVGWSGSAAGTAATVEVMPGEADEVVARFIALGEEKDLELVHGWGFAQEETLGEPEMTAGGALMEFEPGRGTVLRVGTGQGFGTPHLRVDSPLMGSLVFRMPTTGYRRLLLGLDVRRSAQGAGWLVVERTRDGNTWETLGSRVLHDADPERMEWDLGEFPEVSNNWFHAVRISFERGLGGEGGNVRLDRVELWGERMEQIDLPLVELRDPGRVAVQVGGAAMQVEVGDWFGDPERHELIVAANVLDAGLARVDVEGSRLLVTGLRPGESWIRVAVTDGAHPPVERNLNLWVEPRPHGLESGDYVWGAWNPESVALEYPPAMVWVWSDAGQANGMRGYPLRSPDDPNDNRFPYKEIAVNGMRGMMEQGVALARGHGVLLALNTRGLAGGRLSWVIGAVVDGKNPLALQLRYRAGPDLGFVDWLDADGRPLEVVAGSGGEELQVGPLELPESLIGLDNLQLLWICKDPDGATVGGGGDGTDPPVLRFDELRLQGDSVGGYAGWAAARFPVAAPDGWVRPEADFDGDGLANLLEYAFGLNPTDVAQASGGLLELHPVAEDGQQEVCLSYPRRKEHARAGLNYVIESSDNLLRWEEVQLREEVSRDDGVMETVRGFTALAAIRPGSRFFRVRVNLAEDPPATTP